MCKLIVTAGGTNTSQLLVDMNDTFITFIHR